MYSMIAFTSRSQSSEGPLPIGKEPGSPGHVQSHSSSPPGDKTSVLWHLVPSQSPFSEHVNCPLLLEWSH